MFAFEYPRNNEIITGNERCASVSQEFLLKPIRLCKADLPS